MRPSQILAVLVLVFSGAQAEKPLEDRNWIEVTTPNFTIRSTLSKKKTREMAYHAELLRAAILVITNVPSADSLIPTVIYVLPGRDYDDLSGGGNSAGVFLAGVQQDHILIRESSRKSKNSIVKHEFVHDLMRGQSGFDFPKWYVEGLAKYFSGSDLYWGDFRVGTPAGNHPEQLIRLPWIRSNELINSTALKDLGDRDTYMFYAQSWLLVHYLNHATNRPVSMTDGLQRYAELRQSGASEYDSFFSAFELDPDTMRSVLLRYLQQECCQVFRMDADQLVPEYEPRLRELPRAQVALGLVQIVLRLRAYESAQHWIDIAMASPDTRVQALTSSAQIAVIKNDAGMAEDFLREARVLGPDDPQVHTAQAEFLIWKADKTGDPEQRTSYLNAAQQSLVDAWKLDKTIPHVYSLTGKTYLMLQSNNDRAIEMLEQAVSLAPSNLDSRYALAVAYSHADRKDEAMALARSLSSWSHGYEGIRDDALELIQSLEEQDAEPTREN